MKAYMVVYETEGVLMSAAEYSESAHEATLAVMRHYGADRIIMVSGPDDSHRTAPLAGVEAA